MKFFAIGGNPDGRKTKIFYSNATECKIKTVNKLSCANYHYSSHDPEGAESSFHEMENDYPRIVSKILAHEDLKKSEYYGIILTMIDFHARNPSYENLTQEENYRAFELVSRGLMAEFFKNLNGGATNKEDMKSFLEENWVLQPVFSNTEELISSDHPSLLFSINGELAFSFLPISPHYGVIATNKNLVTITGNTVTENDNSYLNALQVARCINYVYSDHDLTGYIGAGKIITKWFAREKFKGYVDGAVWKPEYLEYGSKFPTEFSFLEIVK
jgi:hypothetical protein